MSGAPRDIVEDRRGETRRALRGWTATEILVLTSCCLYLLIFARAASRGIPFWFDEVMGWVPAADPSLRHMLYSWSHGVDGGGIGFYLVERCWFRIFGDSDVSSRLLSSVGFTTAFCLTWAAARQFFSARVVAISITLTWLFSGTLNDQLAQARFYGIFVAAAAWVVLCYLRSTRQNINSGNQLALTFMGHVALVSFHVLGALYSGATLLALMADDNRRGKARPKLYLSIVAAWGVLVLSFEGLRSTSRVGKPYFWIVEPHLPDLLAVYYAWSWPLLVVGVLVLCLCCWRLAHSRKGAQQRLRRVWNDSERMEMWFLVGAWFAIPLALFCYSRIGDPIFYSRYFLPEVIPVTLAFAAALQYAWPGLEDPALPGPLLWGFAAAIGLLVAGYDAHLLLRQWKLSASGYRERIESIAPTGLPVVFESAFDFTEVLPRHTPDVQVRYRFLLDWADALDPTSPRGDVANYHLMENWKKVGYFSSDIDYAENFLEHTRSFVVVEGGAQRWLQHRILGNPNYECRMIGTVRNGTYRNGADTEGIWLVTRVKGPTGSPP